MGARARGVRAPVLLTRSAGKKGLMIPLIADSCREHAELRARAGEYHFRQRMNIQAYHAAQIFGQGRTFLHPENLPYVRAALLAGLYLTGLYPHGRALARRMHVHDNPIILDRLPPAFHGFRILHLSDLHLDMDRTIVDAMIESLRAVEYDICVITGDLRAETWGGWKEAMDEMKRVMAVLHSPVYAVLGNHDFLEMVPELEKLGARVLLNEHVVFERGADHLYLAGIDDPHFYEADNFVKALDGVPPDAAKILLSHSAETYRQALACEIDLMLCGHTHGGQICYPWGRPLLKNAKQPLRMYRGAWRCQRMQGYTTSGIGCSLVPVRLFAAPEIPVHVLMRAGA